MIGIHNFKFQWWRIRNPVLGIRNHGVEPRIQDSLDFPYIGRYDHTVSVSSCAGTKTIPYRASAHIQTISKVRKSGFRNRRNLYLWIPESGKFFLEESGIWGFEIWNTARGIWNPINDWNLESKFHRQSPESSSWNRNPESKTVLDFLTWGEKWSVIYRIGSVKCDPPRRVTLLAKPTFYRFFVCLFFLFHL